MPKSLTAKQTKTLEFLLAGESVTSAARLAGVARETVHRWLRFEWHFQAALNRGQKELLDAAISRLIAVTHQAASNLASAVKEGDLRASSALLKGLGVLPGEPPTIGSDDPLTVKTEAQISQAEARTERFLRWHAPLFREQGTEDEADEAARALPPPRGPFRGN